MTAPGSVAYQEHRNSEAHRAAVKAAMGAEVAATMMPEERENPFCKECQMEFATVDEMLKHRKTDAHKVSAPGLVAPAWSCLPPPPPLASRLVRA